LKKKKKNLNKRRNKIIQMKICMSLLSLLNKKIKYKLEEMNLKRKKKKKKKKKKNPLKRNQYKKKNQKKRNR